MTYQELQRQQESIAARMKLLHDTAEREDRGFTDSEKRMWDGLLEEHESNSNEERLRKMPVNSAVPHYPGFTDSRILQAPAYQSRFFDPKTVPTQALVKLEQQHPPIQLFSIITWQPEWVR